MNVDGVLDTNTVILLPRLSDPACLPEVPTITAVTLAELSGGPLVTRSDSDRAARQTHLQQAEADFDPLPFDAAVARAFGQVASNLRGTTRKSSTRAYDALIASIEIARDLPLYTVNSNDFTGTSSLKLVAVPYPDRIV